MQIRSIQALRGIAACAVVYIHARNSADTLGAVSLIPESLAHVGHAGVDLFFLISGFLMTYLHEGQSGKAAAVKFFTRRVQRIVPLYWILSALGLAVLFLAPHLFQRAISLPWILGNFLFLPVAQPSGVMEHVLVVGWTLDYEMYFYVLFALSLLFRRGLLVLTLAMLASVALGLVLKPVASWPQLLTSGMLLEFLAGAGIAILVRRVRIPPLLGWALLGTGLVLLAVSAEVTGPRQWKWGIPCALILAGCLIARFECRGRIGRLLTSLGDASYSIYLAQVFALPVAAKAAQMLHAQALPADALIVALWASGTAGGALCYHLLEKPVTALWRGRRDAGEAKERVNPRNALERPEARIAT